MICLILSSILSLAPSSAVINPSSVTAPSLTGHCGPADYHPQAGQSSGHAHSPSSATERESYPGLDVTFMERRAGSTPDSHLVDAFTSRD